MKERFFRVVLTGGNGTYVRNIKMINGEMFNAQFLEQSVLDDERKKGRRIDSVTVLHWQEFKSKSDFEQFRKTTP